MTEDAAAGEILLGRLVDIPDGGSAGFSARIGSEERRLMAIRQAGRVFVYVNSCPHMGLPLDFKPGAFLDFDRTHIQCANHGAVFRIEDGHCVIGPCVGADLRAVAVVIREGGLYIQG